MSNIMGKTSLTKMFQKPLSERLITAVKENDVAQLKLLHKAGKSFSAYTKDGNTLLHIAIQNQVDGSTLEAFEYLLSLSHMPKNAANAFKNTPLMEAFGCKTNGEDYATMLIEAGCDIHVTFPDGNTPLHLAVYNKWLDVAELLVEKGLDVDCQNSVEETPLHVAGRVGAVDIAWMLLFFGADPNMTFTTTADYLDWPITTYTFFDVIASNKRRQEMREVFFDPSFVYPKCLSLMTFIEAMEAEHPLFYIILDCTCDINYTYDDLKLFSKRLYVLRAKMLSMFIQKFGYVLEDMFHRCCLDGLFFCGEPYFIENYSQNFFALLQSDVVSTLIDKVNTSTLPLLVHLVESFTIYRDHLELLTQVLCGILSYGAHMTAEAVNEIYFSFGYSELFKIVLHMDIHHVTRCLSNRYVLPRIIYDMNTHSNAVYTEAVCDDPIIYKISEYYTLSQMRTSVNEFPVPTLVELARNASRQYIITEFKANTSVKFYTILRKLPIAELHKKMISFEKPLYFP